MATQDFPTGVKSRGGFFDIDPAVIQVKPDLSVRTFNSKLAAHATLKQQIKTQTMLNAIVVSFVGGVVTLIDGALRFGALQELAHEAGATLKSIRCVAEEKGISSEVRTLRLLTYNAGVPLTPLETGEIIARLKVFGWKDKEIAEKIGQTTRYVQKLYRLADSKEEYKERVQRGVIAATLASELLEKLGPEKASEVLAEAEKIATPDADGSVTIAPKTTEQAIVNLSEGGTPGTPPPAKGVKVSDPKMPKAPEPKTAAQLKAEKAAADKAATENAARDKELATARAAVEAQNAKIAEMQKAADAAENAEIERKRLTELNNRRDVPNDTSEPTVKLRAPQPVRGPFVAVGTEVYSGEHPVGGNRDSFLSASSPLDAHDAAYMLNIASATLIRGSDKRIAKLAQPVNPPKAATGPTREVAAA